MNKEIIPYYCIAVILMAVLTVAYSEFGAPAEFGNLTNTTCWIGGDLGELRCLGELNVSSIITDEINISGDIDIGGTATIGAIETENINATGNLTVADMATIGSLNITNYDVYGELHFHDTLWLGDFWDGDCRPSGDVVQYIDEWGTFYCADVSALVNETINVTEICLNSSCVDDWSDVSTPTGLDSAYDVGENVIDVDTDDVIWNLTSAQNFIVQDNGVDVFVVNGSRVGIGTSNPYAPLHVVKGNSAGTATASGFESGIFQNDAFNQFVILGVSSSSSELAFGDVQDMDRGRIRYNHLLDVMQFMVRGSTVIQFSATRYGLGLKDGSVSEAGLHKSDDINTGIYFPTFDTLAITAGGIEFLRFDEDGSDVTIFNEGSLDQDFRIETDTETHMFYIDSGEKLTNISGGYGSTGVTIYDDGNISTDGTISGSISAANVDRDIPSNCSPNYAVTGWDNDLSTTYCTQFQPPGNYPENGSHANFSYLAGNVEVGGNITADNVFLPAYVSSHTNDTIPVASAGVWYNVTFDHGADEFKKRITHNPADGTNTTFTIQDDGVYEITYTLSFEDSAVVPTSHIVTRVTNNDVELNGFTIETDLGIQNTETSLHHSDLIELATDDEIVLSFTSDDTTVSLTSHLTYGIHRNTGHLTIKRIA